jgi:23S rRNA (uracil1939-C5)-methyltransferase
VSAVGERRPPGVPTEPQTVEVELSGMGRGGEATGTLDGQKVFAAFGLPGERVEVDVWERRPDRIWGRVVRVLRPSPHRVAPRCPLFGTCGGCQWQHVDYQHQIDLKAEMVATHLADGAGFANPPVRPTLPSPVVYGYRNHVRFSVGRRHGELGFTTHFGHRFLRVDDCPIVHPRINEVLAATQGRARGHQLAVRVGVHTGDLLANPAQEDPDLPYKSGQAWLEEVLLGRRYRVSAAAFFQVNTWQAARMIEVVRAALDPQPDDVLLDLYCGVGTFALALAPSVRRVIGVEESAAALRDARHNARDLANVEFVAGRTEEVLAGLVEPASAAIVDPPRSGCRPGALQALVQLAPRRLVYVSCDASTLARDLRVLTDGGFILQSVQPIDMFPQTYHVETVTLLELPAG